MILQENPTEPKITEVMLAMFSALGYAVSARFLLLLSLIGAFALSMMAMSSQTTMSAIIVSLYCLFTTVPLVVLEVRNRLVKE